ncbi:MAG TPA: hypothetical protein VII53_07905 [Solirubrobacteraceae bacterium]
MQSIFPIVVFGAVALSVVMSMVFFAGRGSGGSMYDQIGAGGISRDSEAPNRDSEPAVSASAERAEQEREIRQMLRAKSERLERRGKPALDIDGEIARLLAPAPRSTPDAGLVEEVRQLVQAKNARRVRKGLEPLDLDAEVERTLAELNP